MACFSPRSRCDLTGRRSFSHANISLGFNNVSVGSYRPTTRVSQGTYEEIILGGGTPSDARPITAAVSVRLSAPTLLVIKFFHRKCLVQLLWCGDSIRRCTGNKMPKTHPTNPLYHLCSVSCIANRKSWHCRVSASCCFPIIRGGVALISTVVIK